MITVKELASQIMEIDVKGSLLPEIWEGYLQAATNLLDTAQDKVYILSNFSDVTSFNSEFTMIDTAEYLTHPNLGWNSLLCLPSVIVFQLQLGINRAHKAEKPLPLQVCREYDHAVAWLKQAREMDSPAYFN